MRHFSTKPSPLSSLFSSLFLICSSLLFSSLSSFILSGSLDLLLSSLLSRLSYSLLSLFLCLLSLSLSVTLSLSLSLSLSVSVCCCGGCVLLVLCLVLCLVLWCVCGVVKCDTLKNIRVYVQNVPTCTGTTRTLSCPILLWNSDDARTYVLEGRDPFPQETCRCPSMLQRLPLVEIDKCLMAVCVNCCCCAFTFSVSTCGASERLT